MAHEAQCVSEFAVPWTKPVPAGHAALVCALQADWSNVLENMPSPQTLQAESVMSVAATNPLPLPHLVTETGVHAVSSLSLAANDLPSVQGEQTPSNWVVAAIR